MFWAAVLCRLWNGIRKRKGAVSWGGTVGIAIKKAVFRLVAVVITVCLTITGAYEFVIILRNNGVGRRVSVNLNSALTEWLAENLDHEDLLLTPEYSMNEVTMSGVMLYCGWPYYAWSAGYDTNYRAARAVEIYTSEDEETVQAVVEQEDITYILFEEGMTFEEQDCREDVIARLYPLVYETEDGRIRIYETGQQTEADGQEEIN
jgi:hypothetical protein